MAGREVGFIVDDEYKAWIENIKNRIKHSQIKASVKVNHEMLDLYWDIGRDIVAKQKNAKWGEAFLATMSKDLRKTFPNMSGFSVQNLKSIRYWYKFYNSDENGLQAVSQMELIEKIIKSIPWGHNQRIMYKCKNIAEALFYAQKTMDNGWSRTVLEHQIDSGLYGRQIHLHVGESDFYMDLLFYHVRLHCYVVVELKTEKFKPEFAGKLNFYVTAVNKQMKTEKDNPTIGILICKDKDDVVAEYALDDISQPIGIAEYELTKVLREEFKSSLPTVEEIESELSE